MSERGKYRIEFAKTVEDFKNGLSADFRWEYNLKDCKDTIKRIFADPEYKELGYAAVCVAKDGDPEVVKDFFKKPVRRPHPDMKGEPSDV